MKKVRKLNGYRVIYKPEHPRCISSDNWRGYIYEHIFVAEKFLGRKLRENEVVHHLDETRTNNKKENLLILERGQHTKLHNWLRSVAKEKSLDDNWVKTEESNSNRFCEVCEMILQTNQKKYCSNDCKAIGSQKTDHPTKERLSELINSESWVEIGRMYDVSDNAIRKWARKYDLI